MLLCVQEGKKHRAGRAVITLYELADRLNELEILRGMIQGGASQTQDEFLATSMEIFTTIGSVTNTLFTNNVGIFTARAAAAATTITNAANAISNVGASVTDVQSYITNAVNNEANARAAAKASMDATVGSLSTTVGNGLQQAVADRSSIRAQARSNDPAATLLFASNSQAVVETNREANDNSTRLAAEASIRVVRSNSVAASISTEFSRADARATAAGAAFSFGFQSLNGSLDDTACVGQGRAYYSTSKGTIYVCTGTFWVPVIVDSTFARCVCVNMYADALASLCAVGRNGFFGGGILSSTQRQQIELALGSHTTWSLCYRASTDGWNSNTFHNNCNGKGKH